MLLIQQTVYSWEGSINKFIVDDKGLLVLCVFGLPPIFHYDDPIRAVCAARAIVDAIPTKLGDDGVTCSVGVTTGMHAFEINSPLSGNFPGRAFCGVIGSIERREYTVCCSYEHSCVPVTSVNRSWATWSISLRG